MSDKYIIKNCPCYYLETCGAEDVEEQYCEDCTDCLLKQIVELCKPAEGIDIFALHILQMLQIEEVE